MSRCDGLTKVLMDRPYTSHNRATIYTLDSIVSRTEREDVVDEDDRTQIVNFIPHGMESENQNEMAEYEVFQKMNYYRK